MPGPNLAELKRCVERFTGRDGVHPTAIAPLSLLQASATSEPVQGVYEPALCIVAQGSKRAMLADEVYHHEPAHQLLVSSSRNTTDPRTASPAAGQDTFSLMRTARTEPGREPNRNASPDVP